MDVERDAHPHFPASEKVFVGILRPVEIMAATSSTLQCLQMNAEHKTADYGSLTHSSLTGPVVP